jgi:hypothetical protein
MPDNARRDEKSDPSPDALRRLEERLDRASRAAERLITEAGSEGPRGEGGSGPRGERDSGPARKPPPAGWRAPSSGTPDGGELELLAQLIQSVRELVPAELQRRLSEALRELLLALRALIDFYLERVERPDAAPSEVDDIPIT